MCDYDTFDNLKRAFPTISSNNDENNEGQQQEQQLLLTTVLPVVRVLC